MSRATYGYLITGAAFFAGGPIAAGLVFLCLRESGQFRDVT